MDGWMDDKIPATAITLPLSFSTLEGWKCLRKIVFENITPIPRNGFVPVVFSSWEPFSYL